MKSLERWLQVNLAVTLVIVMGLIWLTGNLLPRPADSHSVSAGICGLNTPSSTESTRTPPFTERPARRFTWLFPLLAGAGVMLILLVQGVVIRLAFRRLDALRAELSQLENGEITRLNEQVPGEIQPIVREVNRLLTHMQERLERSRHALGNLAHALKGPLNLLTQQLDQQVLAVESAELARLQVERIRLLTDRELKRARLAGTGRVATQRFDPHQELPVLVEVLARMYQKPQTCIELAIAPGVPRFGDREDMLELIGNLLDNACKWAQTRVLCRLSLEQGRLQLSVDDDGAGLAAEALQQLTERGIRLDESVEGHGLGLAICKDIVKLYGGQLRFESPGRLGGLRVRVSLPVG